MVFVAVLFVELGDDAAGFGLLALGRRPSSTVDRPAPPGKLVFVNHSLLRSGVGVASTAGITAGGLSLFNAATAPAAIAPVGDAATADATPASTPVGESGSPLNVSSANGVPFNTPSTVNGIDYSGHALDQMQSRGIPPSAVENTIQQGIPAPGNTATTTTYYEPVNNLTVVTDTSSGRVVTVHQGQP